MNLKTAALCVVAYLAGAYAGNIIMAVWTGYQNQSRGTP